jgi:p24 family protein alpha
LQGAISFTTDVAGEHSLCFASNSSRWFSSPRKFVSLGVAVRLARGSHWGLRSQRLDLKLVIGEMAIDYAEVAKKEHLSGLDLEVRRLNDKAQDIIKEQKYQRDREAMFRNTSESSNSRVMWWSFFQMAVILVAGVWQVLYLKDYLQKKKSR